MTSPAGESGELWLGREKVSPASLKNLRPGRLTVE